MTHTLYCFQQFALFSAICLFYLSERYPLLTLFAVILHIFLTEPYGADRFIELPDKVDRIKLASRSTQATADAFILVNNGGTTSEAACSFFLQLFLCEGQPFIRLGTDLIRCYKRHLSGSIIVADIVKIEIALIKCFIFTSVTGK